MATDIQHSLVPHAVLLAFPPQVLNVLVRAAPIVHPSSGSPPADNSFHLSSRRLSQFLPLSAPHWNLHVMLLHLRSTLARRAVTLLELLLQGDQKCLSAAGSEKQ